MSEKKMEVVIVGLLLVDHRQVSAERLLRSIADFVKLRKEGKIGKIVYSTWKGEVDKVAGLRERLKEAGVILIESQQPFPPGECHVWCQMRSMELGLRALPNGEANPLVLKTRADMYIGLDLLNKVHEKMTASAPIPAYLPPVFSRRVWVPWMEVSVPFYVSDLCFMGGYSDLKRLINYDTSYDVLYPWRVGITHYRRFVHPFLEEFPALNLFLEYYVDLWTHGSGKRYEVLRSYLNEDFYLKMLALYFFIMNHYFYVYSDFGSIEFREYCDGKRTTHLNHFTENFEPRCATIRRSGKIFCYDHTWLENVESGNVESDAVYERFRSFYGSLERTGRNITASDLEEAVSFQRRVRELYPDPAVTRRTPVKEKIKKGSYRILKPYLNKVQKWAYTDV